MTATLTAAGLQRLQQAYPAALASVRTNVMDHLADLDLESFATAVGDFGQDRQQAAKRKPPRREGHPRA